MTKEELFVCQCTCSDHIFYITLDDYSDEDNPYDKEKADLSLSFNLNHFYGFWKRLWIGIKYICGRACQENHFDDVLLKYKDTDRLIGILQKYKNLVEENRKN